MSYPDISAPLSPPTESVELLPPDVTFEDASKAANELIDFTTPPSLDNVDTNDLGEKCDHPGCEHIEFGKHRGNAMIRHGVLAHPADHEEEIRKIAEKLKKDTTKKSKNKKTKKSKAGKKGGSRHRRHSKKRNVRKTHRKKRVRPSRKSKRGRRTRKSRRS